MTPSLSAAALDSIWYRTTDLHGHLAGKTVFIAGIHGFYGRVFAAALADWRVRGIDVSVTGASRRDGLDIVRTATHPATLADADYVINCAGTYDGASDVDLHLTHGMAPAGLRLTMRREATLLHVSSGAAGRKLTTLGIAKEAGEHTLATTGLPNQIVRPFATIGPGLDLSKPFAISTFIRARLAGLPLEVPARPVTRSFSHIADIVAQSLHVMIHGDGRPYEVGTDDTITIEEAARLISQDVRVVDREYPSLSGEDHYAPDLTRLHRHFNLTAEWDSARAVMDTLNHALAQAAQPTA